MYGFITRRNRCRSGSDRRFRGSSSNSRLNIFHEKKKQRSDKETESFLDAEEASVIINVSTIVVYTPESVYYYNIFYGAVEFSLKSGKIWFSMRTGFTQNVCISCAENLKRQIHINRIRVLSALCTICGERKFQIHFN